MNMNRYIRVRDFIGTCQENVDVTIYENDSFGDEPLYSGNIFDITGELLLAYIVSWVLISDSSMELLVDLF